MFCRLKCFVAEGLLVCLYYNVIPMPSKCPRLNPKMARLQIGVKIQFRSEHSAIKEDSCFMFLSDLRDQDMINICINILETLNDVCFDC